MPKVDKLPPNLRPFVFHGVDVAAEEGAAQAVGTCPLCGKEGKFGVEVATGKWHCFVCGAKGNPLTFLRQLWESCGKDGLVELSAERGLLSWETLQTWGVVRSSLTDDWLVPGYGTGGKLDQLYKYTLNHKTGKRILLATSGLPHALHGAHLYDPGKPEVWVLEGPWDGMAMWEIAQLAKQGSDGLVLTGNPIASLGATTNILAVPGCQVFHEHWLPLCDGKHVTIFYDSDHPKRVVGNLVPPAGFTGLKKAAALIATVAASVRWLAWGPEGYNPAYPSGYDVRDWLTEAGDQPNQRVVALGNLLQLVQPVPEEWTGASTTKRPSTLQSQECTSWKPMYTAWTKALALRQDITDALAVMLAVVVSTDRKGDQLFMQIVADAGSAKTRLCDALLVSPHCFALEHLTGFHSGWKGEDKEDDFSLLARINHKTLITPEGDVLMSSPKFLEIMSQQRRIFDGTSGATYKNRKEDIRYTGLRTPWIIAGTPTLMEMDQSRLGDRFLRVCIDPPIEEEKQAILKRVGYTALRSLLQESNGSADGIVEKHMQAAYCLTGGYVDYLRAHTSQLLEQVVGNLDDEREAQLVAYCTHRADFVSYLRARPSPRKDQEVSAMQELPTRLQHQFVRLAACLAVVLNKDLLDPEVLRIITKVALDTARGRTLNIVRALYHADEGLELKAIADMTKQTTDAEHKRLRFLRELRAVRCREVPRKGGGLSKSKRWSLAPRLRELYQEINADD